MSELERAILEIREDIASIKSRLETAGPRIGEASLCKYHSEQIDKLATKIYVWSGGIAVVAFILGIAIPAILKHLKL